MDNIPTAQALTSFEALSLSKAGLPGATRCADLLAGAMSGDPAERMLERCNQNVIAMAAAALGAARQSAPELAEGFRHEGIDVQLLLDSRRPGWIWGRAVARGRNHLGNLLHGIEDFHCPLDLCEDAYLRAGAQALIRLHPAFEFGGPSAALNAPELFMEALERRGPLGHAVADALRERERLPELDALADWLCQNAAACAAQGLLPEIFSHSGMLLSQSCGAEPLIIGRWEALAPGQTLSRDLEGSNAIDILQALPDVWGFDDEPAWILPGLDQGREAIWTALCSHLSRASRFGWGRLPRWSTEGASERLGAALEAREIREEASQPNARPPKARL